MSEEATQTEKPEPIAPPAPAQVTMTQEELNRVISERIERERAKFADYDATKAELESLRIQQMSEQEKAVADAVRTAVADTTAQAEARIKRAELKALAAGRLNDAEDAVRYIDPAALPLDDSGRLDEGKARSMIEALVTERPYLAQQVDARRFAGGADAGVSGDSPKDLAAMDFKTYRAARAAKP